MSDEHVSPGRQRENARREEGLHLVMRFVATLRTGRSYAIGNPVFARQLEQLLLALQPLFAEDGHALVVSIDGDVHVNDARLPLRANAQRHLEQMAQEFSVRAIGGVEFRAGLRLEELEEFMRYFLPSELYKGGELYHACATHNLQHVLPVEPSAPEALAEAPPGIDVPEREPALHACRRALQGARLLLGDGTWRNGVELRHLKRVVHTLVDAAYADVSAATVLADGVPESCAPWEHAVHVSVLAVAIGRTLGLGRDELTALGVAALLHDAGQPAVAARVPHAPSRRGPAERAECESHAIEGLRTIALSTTLNATTVAAMRGALEHHAGGPDGFPALPPGWAPSLLSRIVGIADAYVGLLAHRDPAGEPLTPYAALGRLLGPLAPAFPAGLRASLVRTLGVYPPGQVVELEDGSLARTLGCAPENPERPLLERLAEPVAPDAPVTGWLEPGRGIRRALPRTEWPPHLRAA